MGDCTLSALKRLLARPGLSEVRSVDLLLHLPLHYKDFSLASSLRAAPSGRTVSLCVHVASHHPPQRRTRSPYRVLVRHNTDVLTLTFFGKKYLNLIERLPVGEERYISGVLERNSEGYSITHPEHIVAPWAFKSLHRLEPVYPLTYGLSNRYMIRLVSQILDAMKPYDQSLPFWHSEETEGSGLSFVHALEAVHRPLRHGDIHRTPQEAYKCIEQGRKRLVYDEYLAHQVALARCRDQWCAPRAQRESLSHSMDGEICDSLEAHLPFILTPGQKEALRSIHKDMTSSHRMLRLLHGDVGSGKTIVAFLAAVMAVRAREQSAFMAPTSLLAHQHYMRLLPLAQKLGIRMGLLTGRQPARERAKVRKALIQGELDCLIGTHALFQESVEFANLGLVIIDEQHRFGVQQRLALSQKKPNGGGVDVLLTTATPIPRTLTLTLFGDMDVSLLKDMPVGRQKVDTRVISLDRLETLMLALERAMAQGARIYWVCPRISESEAGKEAESLSLTTVEERTRILRERFGMCVGFVHGKMDESEKQEAVEKFALGQLSILVATTVIEVGVDVPEATVMVIEHAERFGLSQLHQLRGRVGRGTKPATCFLLYRKPLSATSQARLSIIRETTDGFAIAKKDWHLRGEGDLVGTRQSGMPDFRLVDVEDMDEELMDRAHRDARQWVAQKRLDDARLSFLLELFNRHEALTFREAG